MGDGFCGSKDPTNSIKVLKEKATKENPENTKKTQNDICIHIRKIVDYNKIHIIKHSMSPYFTLIWGDWGRLPQTAGLPDLNGGGAVAAVPQA